MKKFFLFLIAVLIIVPNLYAEDKNAGDDSGALNTSDVTIERTPLNKIVRGTVNMATCPVELPASIFDVCHKDGLAKGYTVGIVDGLVTTVFRFVTGAFDTVTFLIPPYDKPILEPEYAIDSAIEKMKDE